MSNEKTTTYSLQPTNSLRAKRVTVMGLGLHGGALGTIKWLHEQGANITVTDLKTPEQLASSIEKLRELPRLKFVLGQHRKENFTDADLIIRNPAVPKNSEYLQAARKAGVPIEMDSSLFFRYSPSADIIGVTGSKGKTTTASAITAVLKTVNPATVAVGIDGISPLGHLEHIQPTSPAVFELSSWRLEALDEHEMSPRTAVVTSIYREHLNTYESFEDYIAAKKIIFRHQHPDDVAILNWDDPIIRLWAKEIPSKLFWYSLQPLVDGDGIFIQNGLIHLRLFGVNQNMFAADVLPLTADHEQRNLLPAILIGSLRGMKLSEIQSAIGNIKRLPHRLEPVRELEGVTYINDSTATMPDAAIAALRSLSGKMIVLILGGSDKKLVFDELAQHIRQAHIRALIWLPGTATERMKTVINAATNAEKFSAENMQSAVASAHRAAKRGDVVLLSPGATSFGLFVHEFDRGDQFREAVHDL